MNKQESYTLLSKCDRVYALIYEIKLFKESISGLSTENKEKYEFAKQDIEKIKSSKEYYDFLNENNLEDSSNNLLDYCKKRQKQLEDNYNEILFDIDELLLEKYFKKDIEKADRQDRLSPKMLKLCKLLLKNGESIDSENSENRNKLLSIPERLREKEQKYLSSMNEDKLEYKHLFYAYNKIAYLGKTQVNKFLEYIDKMKFSKSDTMIALIRFLESYNKKKDYNKISVKKFSIDENEDKYYI